MKNYGIVIHGGAGNLSQENMSAELVEKYEQGLKASYTKGFEVLDKRGSSIDAVTEAIIILENNPLFNAGKGSVLTHEGHHEMDAAIMDGSDLNAGSVAAVRYIKNPILLARAVMEKSDHVFISGEKARDFAQEHQVNIETKKYFYSEERYLQWKRAIENNKIELDFDDSEKFGTVGATALDQDGQLAVATSTGGMVNKKYGRIGDSPLIGIGTYANNDSCAISCTGHGEYYIRAVVAHDVSSRILYKKQSLKYACNDIIQNVLPKMGGRGGLIGIDKKGTIVMPFNTSAMFRGYKNCKEEFVGIF